MIVDPQTLFISRPRRRIKPTITIRTAALARVYTITTARVPQPHPLIRWLEKSGYDVAYSSNLDTHQNGARLLDFKGFLSPAHDEYWSKEMYDAAEGARNAGVNLAFFGANSIYFQVRFEDSAVGADRIMVSYKDDWRDPTPNPADKTTNWRLVNRPEQGLLGVQFVTLASLAMRLISMIQMPQPQQEQVVQFYQSPLL